MTLPRIVHPTAIPLAMFHWPSECSGLWSTYVRCPRLVSDLHSIHQIKPIQMSYQNVCQTVSNPNISYHITSYHIISAYHIQYWYWIHRYYIDLWPMHGNPKATPAKANTPVRSVRASEGLMEGRSLGFIAPLLLARTFIQTGTHCHHHSISSIPRKMVLWNTHRNYFGM